MIHTKFYKINELMPHANKDDVLLAEAHINRYEYQNIDAQPLFLDLDNLKDIAIDSGAFMYLEKYFNK